MLKKGRRLSALLLVLTLVFALLPAPALAAADGNFSFTSGAGTDVDPYIITTEAQLRDLADEVNSGIGPTTVGVYFKLGNDINLTGDWTPIGNKTYPFKGHFDGNDKTVSNMTFLNPGDYIGLFGYTKDAEIANLTVVGTINETVNTGSTIYAGGIVGYADGTTTVNGCNAFVEVSVTVDNGGTGYAGGIAGYIGDTATISGCLYPHFGSVVGTGTGSVTGCGSIFTARNGVNLYTPTNLIFMTTQYAALSAAGFEFESIQFSLGSGGYTLDHSTPSPAKPVYDPESGRLTIPAAAFGMHSAPIPPGGGRPPLQPGNYTAEITFRHESGPAELTFTCQVTLTRIAPPPPPPPEPEPPNPNPKVPLGRDELDKLKESAVNGVMTLIIEGDLESLEIEVPLSWFLENLGMTLLVYNEAVGLMAITSENMIELAAQSYNGEEGGVTVIINGKEVTFLPETLISYLTVRGSITLTVTADGNSMSWYVYDSPLILGLPGISEDADENLVVVYRETEDGRKILPRSLLRGNLAYVLVSGEGKFDFIYNPVYFDDVKDGWMKPAVDFIAAREIMNGIGDGIFDSEGELTRAQAITILMRMLDYEMSGYDTKPFDDIEDGSWYHESVCKAAALGIVEGVGERQFEPDRPVTREEFFTMTYRALIQFYIIIEQEPGEESEESEDEPKEELSIPDRFTDIEEISDYAMVAMTKLVHEGIVNGYANRLSPQGITTRAEAAQFMANLIRFMVPDYTDILNAEMDA